jgi:hypothetical protein
MDVNELLRAVDEQILQAHRPTAQVDLPECRTFWMTASIAASLAVIAQAAAMWMEQHDLSQPIHDAWPAVYTAPPDIAAIIANPATGTGAFMTSDLDDEHDDPAPHVFALDEVVMVHAEAWDGKSRKGWIVEVDPDDKDLPYRVVTYNPATRSPGHDWYSADELTPIGGAA